MTRWSELVDKLDDLLRLRTFPLAVKRFEKAEDLERVPRVRKFEHIHHFCQLITLTRTLGWTVAATSENVTCTFAMVAGLVPFDKEERAKLRTGVWFNNLEAARKQMASFPSIPGACRAIILAPLRSEKFDPDVILIYGTPTQMMLLINGLQWKDYTRFQFFVSGESSCVDALLQCYVSGKPALTIPCLGERSFGGTQEEELVIALPPDDSLEKAIEGLQGLRSVGMRYPITPAGAHLDLQPMIDMVYG